MGITIQNIILFLFMLVIGKGLEDIGKYIKFIYELKLEEKREQQRNAQTRPTHNQTRW